MPTKQSKGGGRRATSIKQDGHRVQKPVHKSKASRNYKKNDRKKIMQDTIDRTPQIIKSTPGVTGSSVFYKQQLPPLARKNCPNLDRKPTEFILGDTFAVTRQVTSPTTDGNDAKMVDHRQVAVLNMASDVKVAGASGIPSGPTQEDALCLSSTLYATLKAHRDKYPWKKSMSNHEVHGSHCAAIYSHQVVVFKGSSAEGYEELNESQRRVVGVISVAAPRNVRAPKDDQAPASAERKELREKIRMIARIAAEHKKTILVLGAMGCGKFNCDPDVVAREFKAVLMEDEFVGWFEKIVFAIYSQSTLDIFQRAHGTAN